jgi:dimethylaniline monooxygenase (N-oxide forming)
LIDDKPGDLAISRRIIDLKYTLNAISPTLSEGFFNMVIQSLTKKAFKLEPEWRIHPPHSILCHQPTVSDTLCTNLEDGSIISKHSVQEFVGPNTVKFTDSTTAVVDTLICCTGYTRDFTLIPELRNSEMDAWSEKPKSDGQPLQRLYQNIFPPAHSDTIAFLNNFTYPTGYMWIADLASMAVAQVWKGNSSLPSVEEMNLQIDRHHAWLTTLVERETVASDFVQEGDWLYWCHDTAGTGINEYLGYRLAGWDFWARERRLSNLLMGGVETPFALRLFDGKRKKWEGAKQAIINVNQEVSRL